jgi:peptidyl-prolyl cis-trans isomerase A (cyclophilin A)
LHRKGFILKFNILLALATSGILSACGGGGGGSTGTTPSGDTTAPVVASVNQTLTAGSTVTLTATATDNIAVTGYCFKTESTTPLAADACFQATGQKAGLSLAKNLTHYVWAKDAAGNVSAASTGSCSAAGFTASNASTKKVVCMLTDKGQVVVELDTAKAPVTVANFLSYTNAGFYGNTTFHRVISTFMVQGGGFTYANGAYSQKTTNAPIVLEKTSTTGLSNLRGTIAMARTSVANSATSQFFINVVDNAFLDAAGQPDGNGYAVFGKVIAGMDVVDVIKGVPTGTVSGMADAPTTPVYVQWAYQVQ